VCPTAPSGPRVAGMFVQIALSKTAIEGNYVLTSSRVGSVQPQGHCPLSRMVRVSALLRMLEQGPRSASDHMSARLSNPGDAFYVSDISRCGDQQLHVRLHFPSPAL
jgi:hypothetical protein